MSAAIRQGVLGILLGAASFAVFAALSLWSLSAWSGVVVNPFTGHITVGLHHPLAIPGAVVVLATAAAALAAAALGRVGSATAKIVALGLAVTSSAIAGGDPFEIGIGILDRVVIAGGQSVLVYVAAGALLIGALRSWRPRRDAARDEPGGRPG